MCASIKLICRDCHSLNVPGCHNQSGQSIHCAIVDHLLHMVPPLLHMVPLCYIWSPLWYIWSPSATYGPPLLHMVPLCSIWSPLWSPSAPYGPPSATYGPPLLHTVPLCYIWSLLLHMVPSATYGPPSATMVPPLLHMVHPWLGGTISTAMGSSMGTTHTAMAWGRGEHTPS